MAFMIAGLARPTRRTRRARATSCTLARLSTYSTRPPSAGPRRTSVDRPRIVEVTGALITAWSNWPSGSRLRTTIGRTLSSRASHTSPRRGALLVVVDLGIKGLPVGLISETARIGQQGDGRFGGGRREPTVRGDVSAQPLGIDKAIEGKIYGFRS